MAQDSDDKPQETLADAVQTSGEMAWALAQILDKFDQDPAGAKEGLEMLLVAHRDFHAALERMVGEPGPVSAAG